MKYAAIALLFASAEAVKNNQDKLYVFTQLEAASGFTDPAEQLTMDEYDASKLYTEKPKSIEKLNFSEMLEEQAHPDSIEAQQSMQNQKKLWEAIQLDNKFMPTDDRLSVEEEDSLVKDLVSPAQLAGFTGQRPLETYTFAESL